MKKAQTKEWSFEREKAFIEKMRHIHFRSGTFKPHFNYGLGRYVKSRSEVNDAVKEISDTTGQRLVEVGNETPTKENNHNGYKLSDRELHELKNTLNGQD